MSASKLQCDARAERVPEDVHAPESASIEIALERIRERSHRRELAERRGLALPGEIHGEDVEVERELSADLREVCSTRAQSVQQEQRLTGARASGGKERHRERRKCAHAALGTSMNSCSSLAKNLLFTVARHRAPRRMRGPQSGCISTRGMTACSIHCFPW
jgi:hypothetical protein